MSRVFVAEDKALRRMVVIKVLTPDRTESLSADRFEREIHLVARLQHPHIVPLFSAGSVDGVPYYTMPYIDGESLRAKLKRDRALKAPEASRILHDVARALEYAHSHGVVHRDIKPDNILLSGSSACVADFGIARAVKAARADQQDRGSATNLTRRGMTVGTPAYISPEQATGSSDVDHRTDIYSFGCVAFEMLTGTPPFSKSSAQALIAAHIVEQPPLSRLRNGQIPSVLAELVGKCLQKSPDDRPGSASEILTLLETSGSYSSGPRAVAAPLASIAVLPFENMSEEKSNDYFADGISEEIINALTHVEGLRVAGRTSSFAFKGQRVSLAEVGEKLNVDTVLEGSVRKAGNRIRITAQLINASDGYHLWSERFDRELIDVFAIQDEIATAIASRLKLTLNRGTDLAKPLTTNVEAYEYFSKGRELYYLPGRQLVEAIACFKRALSLDPGFALAHAALADALSLSGYYGIVRASEVVDPAHDAALKALELSPGNSDAHHSLALWMTLYGGDRHRALKEWEKVVAGTALRTQVRCSYAIFGLGLLGGDWDGSVKEIDSALALDPLNGFAHAMLAMMKTFAGQLDDVVVYARRAVEIDPGSFWTQLTLQRALHCAGMHSESQSLGQVLLESSGRHPWVLAELAVDLASVGNRDGAEAIYDELRARGRMQHIQPSPVALAATAAHRLDDAIEWCERAIAERDTHIFWAVTGVWDGWQPIYDHPKWKNVRKGIFAWRPGAHS